MWIHGADEAVAKGGRPGPNEGKQLKYLLHFEAWRTLIGLARHGGLKIVPIREVSTYADGQTIEVPGRPRAVHVPGHTPGTATLFFEQRRMFLTGNCLVMKNPLTGRKGPQVMPAGLNRNTDQALASLARLEDIPADVILPGHGEPGPGGRAKPYGERGRQGVPKIALKDEFRA